MTTEMTERDYRKLKRLLYFLPVVTVIISLLIQLGAWQANSANFEKRFDERTQEISKRFDKIEKEKADIDMVNVKFDNIDWKLNLIMKNMGIVYTNPSQIK